MGIQGLSKVIADNAPKAIRENSIGQYFGRKVAIDASMSIYQFLIAVRSEGNMLTNSAGETTSHLMGIFYRTIRMMENGIKPLYVFDGKPPEMKSGELGKRAVKRASAEEAISNAKENGDIAALDKFNRRTVKVTKKHNEECQQLLKLMGVPFIQAPSEAEAQCAALAKAGIVFGAGSEDMDTLTFATPVLLRHLTFSEARKMPISEIHLDTMLEGLELTHEQFIDLCILLGCDYCDSIRGIGPTRALALIKQHGCIEQVLEHLDKDKYKVPEDWPYQQARELFKKPDVLPLDDPAVQAIKWEAPNEEGLIEFMCTQSGFNEVRIKSAIEKLKKTRSKGTQGRLDSFFKKVPSTTEAPVKRPAPAKKAAAAKKAKK